MATITENIQTLRSIKSDIKNAIIQKGGSVTDAFGTYAQAITNLPSGGGGGTEMEDALVTGKLSGTYYNNRVSIVYAYTFTQFYGLTSVNLPNCSSVGEFAFSGCINLLSINIPLCKYVGFNGFAYCNKLSSVNLPLCTSLMNNVFLGDRELQSISLPNCLYVGYGAFNFCTKLPSIHLPLCKTLSKDFFGDGLTFANCSALSIVKIPLCSDIGNYVFRSCNNLKEVYLNSVTSVTTIQSNTFSECPNLTSVYVPASLVDAFKTAQYWSNISNKIVAYTGA